MILAKGMTYFFFVLLLSLSLSSCGGENRDSASESLGLPMLKPIVENSTPESLRSPSSSLLNIEAQSCDAACVVQNSLSGLMLDLMDNNLEIFDQRLAEINQRSTQNLRACTLEEPTAWTVNNLPGGESRTFYFQCAENHGDFLTVYFGVHQGKAYLLERVRGTLASHQVPHDDDSAGDQMLMAIASMDGQSVEIWSARHKGYSEFPATVNRYNRSWLYLNANRSENRLEASVSGNPWPGHELTCGATLRAEQDHFQLNMTLANTNSNWASQNYCDVAPNNWPSQALDVSGCYNAESFTSTPGSCAQFSDLSDIPDLRAQSPGNNTDLTAMGGGCGDPNATLDGVDRPGARGCYARAFTLINSSNLPSLMDFNDIIIEDEDLD